MIYQNDIVLPLYNRGIYLITDYIKDNLPELPQKGLLNILIKHTSAAITINENADPTVRKDLNKFLDKLVPDNTDYFEHIFEGKDDMPAHVKASIIGFSITIPIKNYQYDLGTWQGIYLCEFRNNAGRRTITATIYS